MTSLTLMMNTTAGQGDKRIVSRYELLILYSGENLPASRMVVRTGFRAGFAERGSATLQLPDGALLGKIARVGRAYRIAKRTGRE